MPKLPKRVLDKIEFEGECWLWTGCFVAKGYGQVWANSGMRRAHCYVYEMLVGEVPGGLELDHTCRNRACVNPAHLEPVPHVVNCRRGVGAKTHCVRGHRLAGDNLRIRTRRGAEHRVCRACQRIDQAAYRARKRGMV